MDDAGTQKMLSAYQKLMQEIMHRTEVVLAIINGKPVTGYKQTNYETAALNLRMIAESIVYANMMGHESDYSSLYPSHANDWRLSKIIDRIRAINPKFYPEPTTNEGKNADGAYVLKSLSSGTWMTEPELIDMYDQCSKLAHVTNPFRQDVNLDDYTEKFKIWIDKIIKLLNHHSVEMSSGKEMILCSMNSENTFKPQVVHFVNKPSK